MNEQLPPIDGHDIEGLWSEWMHERERLQAAAGGRLRKGEPRDEYRLIVPPPQSISNDLIEEYDE